MANAPTKPTTPVKNESSSASGAFATLTIPICIVVAICIFVFILGHPSHFKGGNPDNDPNPGDIFGTVHKGGVIVPIILSYLLMVIVFSIERFIVIGRASGTGNVDAFVRKIQAFLNSGNIEAANAECDKQKGSVANVIKSGLKKYREMEVDQTMDVDQKALAIQKDIEEATALEMPMLEQNLTIIATLVSIGTLTGLLGTVIGMIGAFSTLGASGAPNQSELSTHISEALINTALGIGTSAVSIVMYNVFTSKIDKLTYAIDETGFSIVQTFSASHKNRA
ncbi:MotA/TolQ/ExbB proton channel family protein [Mucilaginibacter phyllosphaerae]|uniref:Biopolymer transport protein ExbB n=1 Tax=Mucilaginibacter phyllosphaerae TaxID=1812349 RepID=A0A4Y8ADI9_9SPHI|nr:MotA/TolQ/ExbB proton channel family protein [Mucilaginibacter phyllosphaerae]MBB3970315.1 biopolymer transport protein ExbB [Mucilaginibacter phyllosphaerae]TEW66686.1 MotA/TolQ/ExbB proton channel family protein [Mucilaginibacter phyllosphaerae]GGH11255.1 flagellar motor protein MotA [Mucilaginibacter phyllosphaerae]